MSILNHRVCAFLFLMLAIPGLALAQDQQPAPDGAPIRQTDQAPPKVEVKPTAADAEIEARLRRILQSTGWFRRERVQVRDGIVFLSGATDTAEHKAWAGNLARNTRDVVAAVNRIEIELSNVWNFEPALSEIRDIWRGFVQSLPLVVFGSAVVGFAWTLMLILSKASRGYFIARTSSPLLGNLFARLIALPVLILGLYIVLQVFGLTRLALTILGGTGVAGIIFGFAFRDIAENFLASILLSLRRPFLTGDFISVADRSGYVVQMNTRSTILMTRDGNHVQIPNSTIYKSTMINYSANPNTRDDFVIAVSLAQPVRAAQRIIMSVLNEHKAVLDDPEPFVLIDRIDPGSATLRAYYWYDFTKFAEIRLRSALMRQTIYQLFEEGMAQPVDLLEVQMSKGAKIERAEPVPAEPAASRDETPAETPEEGGLNAEHEEIREQSDRARAPEGGEDLLR